jgi:XTP/dITP diphosphohydrolase
VVDSILIATTNPGKLREIVRVLDGLPCELKTLADFPGVPVAEETGASFAENARQKARHYAGITGMVTLAEDSGFEIDALDGDPGIHSARYLREDATYAQRFADIYRRVRQRGSADRRARFV